MKDDIYHLVTVENGKSDTAAIVKVFSDMLSGRLKNDIRLVNYHNEVPVSYASTISTVETDSIELSVHEHQAVLMKHDKWTLIKSRHFHNQLSVHCYTSYINLPKKAAILHNFAYAQIRADRREAVRVKVHGSLPVTFSYDNVILEGSLVDISATGASMLSSVVPATVADQPGMFSFTLVDAKLVVSGSFVRSIKKEDDKHICILQMKPDIKSDNIIGQFIYQRQVEIIQELKDGIVQ